MTQHSQADQLIDLINDNNLELTLRRGTITWEARGSSSTIDLISDFYVRKSGEPCGTLHDKRTFKSIIRSHSDIDTSTARVQTRIDKKKKSMKTDRHENYKRHAIELEHWDNTTEFDQRNRRSSNGSAKFSFKN